MKLHGTVFCNSSESFAQPPHRESGFGPRYGRMSWGKRLTQLGSLDLGSSKEAICDIWEFDQYKPPRESKWKWETCGTGYLERNLAGIKKKCWQLLSAVTNPLADQYQVKPGWHEERRLPCQSQADPRALTSTQGFLSTVISTLTAAHSNDWIQKALKWRMLLSR